MNRKKKTYVSIMALCAAALLVDRLLLPAPSGAVAGDAELSTSRNAGIGISPTAARTPAPEIPFPRGVTTAADLGSLRDPFAAPLTMTGAAAKPTAAESASNEQSAIGREQFAERHQLTGILSDGAIAVAIVGDQWLSPGGELDGCVLKSVEKQSAVFECSDGEAKIFLPNSADSDRKNR